MSHGRYCPANQADWHTIAYRGQTHELGPLSSTRDVFCRPFLGFYWFHQARK